MDRFGGTVVESFGKIWGFVEDGVLPRVCDRLRGGGLIGPLVLVLVRPSTTDEALLIGVSNREEGGFII